MADLTVVPDILDEIRTLMKFSVRCGGPMRLYGGLARSCRTLGGCVGGYVASSLAADTPQLMGGFETTFWRS